MLCHFTQSCVITRSDGLQDGQCCVISRKVASSHAATVFTPATFHVAYKSEGHRASKLTSLTRTSSSSEIAGVIRLQVPPRFELGSLDSESRVLTITPWNPTTLTRTSSSFAYAILEIFSSTTMRTCLRV